MTFDQVIKEACTHARQGAYEKYTGDKKGAADKGLNIAVYADDFNHLAQLLAEQEATEYIVMREYEDGLAKADEYWREHYCTLYLKWVTDTVRIWQLLGGLSINPAAIRAYAKIVGGKDYVE